MKIERTEDLETCRAIRRAVFVQEQNVPEDEEWDGLDGAAIHLLARDDQGAAVGTARILLADEALAGLSVAEGERVGNLIKPVMLDLPVLLGAHGMDRVIALAGHVSVMNEGKVLLAGDVEAARTWN